MFGPQPCVALLAIGESTDEMEKAEVDSERERRRRAACSPTPMESGVRMLGGDSRRLSWPVDCGELPVGRDWTVEGWGTGEGAEDGGVVGRATDVRPTGGNGSDSELLPSEEANARGS